MSYFDAVVGQEHIKNHIKTLLEDGSLPHSILLYGEKGLGKLAMAKAIGSTILGRSIFTESVEAGLHIYIDKGQAFWLKPVTSSGLKIDQWQILLKDYLSKTANGPRIVIIEDFQTARPDFANAILKSIEEPPQGVYFFLLTTKKNVILPTILSRCMLVPLVEADRQAVEERLHQEGYGIEAEEYALLSQGNYGRAKALLEDNYAKQLETAILIMEMLVTSSIAFTECALQLNDSSREDLVKVFNWMRILARDIMALQFGANDDILQFPNLKDRLWRLMPKWNAKALQCLVEESLKSESALRLNIRNSLVVDALLLALEKELKE